jgi:16S rRNA (guanine1207-N2)-methyltransferase
MKDPWFKSTFRYSALGKNLLIDIPHDVFSTQRIDEGTLLLLDHLPESNPKTILDMGCGYGALGLPIAATYSQARVDMVDRDLLAAAWSQKNATTNHLQNVRAFGSLGFNSVEQTYDWILCNVPARIGEPFIQNLISLGTSRLNPGGELRVVVINDLLPLMSKMELVIKGPRHSILLKKATQKPESIVPAESLYLRDQVKFSELLFDRPFDFGGDDQKRLKTGLSVLMDALPRSVSQTEFKILNFRPGYGPIPLYCAHKWPQSKVIAIDRDLLGTTFIRHNASKLGLTDRIQIRETAHFPDAIEDHEQFNLIIGELSPSAGEAVALSELSTIERSLANGGEAIVLCLDKIEKDWIKKFSKTSKLSIFKVLSREGYAVVRLAK